MKRLSGAALFLGLAALFALNVVWIARNRHALGGTRPGHQAPDWSLPLLDGGQARLADYRGRKLVLSFWATWCGPCVAELPDVQRLSDELTSVAFVAVNIDSGAPVEVIRAFRQRNGLRMPVALDDGSAAQAYRVDTIPRTIVVDQDGRITRVLDGAHSLQDLREAIQN